MGRITMIILKSQSNNKSRRWEEELGEKNSFSLGALKWVVTCRLRVLNTTVNLVKHFYSECYV